MSIARSTSLIFWSASTNLARVYQVYYHDSNLGFCPAGGFNATNGIAIARGSQFHRRMHRLIHALPARTSNERVESSRSPPGEFGVGLQVTETGEPIGASVSRHGRPLHQIPLRLASTC
jgi:hypothetical protein